MNNDLMPIILLTIYIFDLVMLVILVGLRIIKGEKTPRQAVVFLIGTVLAGVLGLFLSSIVDEKQDYLRMFLEGVSIEVLGAAVTMVFLQYFTDVFNRKQQRQQEARVQEIEKVVLKVDTLSADVAEMKELLRALLQEHQKQDDRPSNSRWGLFRRWFN
jgi:hypothetical protein